MQDNNATDFIRFNSQRDGILRFPACLGLRKNFMFQFPTGWNSTISSGTITAKDMGFNSQRDGILHAANPKFRASYSCFNSQRDGILRFPPYRAAYQFIVSIPNGMEFYIVSSPSIIILFSFQFPTGWNSTKRFFLLVHIIRMFQFPTGWNSTLYCVSLQPCGFVSIPNGMEFYFRIALDFVQPHIVSIPNGMEFYSTNFSIFLGRKC